MFIATMTTTVSFKTEEELLQWVNSRPEQEQEQAVELEGIIKGGSVRRFYRVLGSTQNSLGVLMEYSREKEENGYYTGISSFMQHLKVPVPQVINHDADQGLAVLEDLGHQDLYQLKDLPWPELKAHYVQVLKAIQLLWATEQKDAEAFAELKLMPGFDSQLYTWERDYFFDQYLMRSSQDTKPESREVMHRECELIQELLLKQPLHLVHRDFQSQNIMITEKGPVFIDFQGMRAGTWFYDLASLLYDPYMNLSENRRDELLDVAAEMMEWSVSDIEFDLIFSAAAIQRLMQALGAYGYLGEELGKEEFLQYIPVARKELLQLVTEMEMTSLLHLLKPPSEDKGKNSNRTGRKKR